MIWLVAGMVIAWLRRLVWLDGGTADPTTFGLSVGADYYWIQLVYASNQQHILNLCSCLCLCLCLHFYIKLYLWRLAIF